MELLIEFQKCKRLNSLNVKVYKKCSFALNKFSGRFLWLSH